MTGKMNVSYKFRKYRDKKSFQSWNSQSRDFQNLLTKYQKSTKNIDSYIKLVASREYVSYITNTHDLHDTSVKPSLAMNYFDELQKYLYKNSEKLTTHSLSKDKNAKNEAAFNKFKLDHIDDPKFKNKFVAFVHGSFQDSDDAPNTLIQNMYDKFGNVPMYVDKITNSKKIIRLRTPRFV